MVTQIVGGWQTFSCECYWLVDNLPLDYLVGPNGESTNFDAKYLAKRSWCRLLREKVTIDGIVLTKNLIKELIEGNSFSVTEQSLYPKDKQNVKSATSFLLAFIEGCRKMDLPYNLMPIQSQLAMLGEVFAGLLHFYVYSDSSIRANKMFFGRSIPSLLFVYWKSYIHYASTALPWPAGHIPQCIVLLCKE